MLEMINHPKHYAGNIECIDAMVDCFGFEETMAFCLLNSFKYLWRCEKKENKSEDIKKSIWYLNEYLKLENCKNESTHTNSV